MQKFAATPQNVLPKSRAWCKFEARNIDQSKSYPTFYPGIVMLSFIPNVQDVHEAPCYFLNTKSMYKYMKDSYSY